MAKRSRTTDTRNGLVCLWTQRVTTCDTELLLDLSQLDDLEHYVSQGISRCGKSATVRTRVLGRMRDQWVFHVVFYQVLFSFRLNNT